MISNCCTWLESLSIDSRVQHFVAGVCQASEMHKFFICQITLHYFQYITQGRNVFITWIHPYIGSADPLVQYMKLGNISDSASNWGLHLVPSISKIARSPTHRLKKKKRLFCHIAKTACLNFEVFIDFWGAVRGCHGWQKYLELSLEMWHLSSIWQCCGTLIKQGWVMSTSSGRTLLTVLVLSEDGACKDVQPDPFPALTQLCAATRWRSLSTSSIWCSNVEDIAFQITHFGKLGELHGADSRL